MAALIDPSTVRRIGFFSALPPETAAQVAGLLRPHRAAKGYRYFGQGEPAEHCFAVLDGQVKVAQISPEGQQVVLNFFGPGQMFGTLAVLGGSPYPAEATAVGETLTVSWSKGDMLRMMDEHPPIAMAANRIMMGRFQELQTRLREMHTERVERRIAHTLLRLVRQSGRRTDEGVVIDIPLSRQDIGEMTGTTLHTVSRTLSAWEQEGWVECGRQRVVIRNPHALVTIAEDLSG